MTRRNYRLPSRPARLGRTDGVVRAGLLMLFVVAFSCTLGGCKTAEEVRDEQQRALDAPSEPEILYQAILDTYESRKYPVDIASKRHMTVASNFQNLSESLRRRFVSRIIVLRNGIALRVRSHYQVLEPAKDGPTWVDAGPEFQKRRETDEAEVGEAIQRRFHELR